MDFGRDHPFAAVGRCVRYRACTCGGASGPPADDAGLIDAALFSHWCLLSWITRFRPWFYGRPMRPWLQRTNVWRRVTSPARGAEQLKKGGKRVSAGFARRCRQVQREGRDVRRCTGERINVNDDQAPLPMTDQADKRGQLVRHLEEALALADDTPARAPVLRNLTKQWLKLALELERTQASLDEREPKA